MSDVLGDIMKASLYSEAGTLLQEWYGKDMYLESDEGSWTVYEKVPGVRKDVTVASGLGGIVCVNYAPDDRVSSQ